MLAIRPTTPRAERLTSSCAYGPSLRRVNLVKRSFTWRLGRLHNVGQIASGELTRLTRSFHSPFYGRSLMIRRRRMHTSATRVRRTRRPAATRSASASDNTTPSQLQSSRRLQQCTWPIPCRPTHSGTSLVGMRVMRSNATARPNGDRFLGFAHRPNMGRFLRACSSSSASLR
jgi:hypothetical protein